MRDFVETLDRIRDEIPDSDPEGKPIIDAICGLERVVAYTAPEARWEKHGMFFQKALFAACGLSSGDVRIIMRMKRWQKTCLEIWSGRR